MQHVLSRIVDQMQEFSRLSPRAEYRNEEVSGWSVGQQIEHVLIAMSGMALALRKERLSKTRKVDNQLKIDVLNSGSFPRGVIQAPEISLPRVFVNHDDLKRLLLKTSNRISGLLDLSKRSTIDHPILGEMSRDETIRFMVIHNDHHLKIIADILPE